MSARKPGLPCTGILKPLPPVYQKLKIENLTVVKPPMLKIYYWEHFDITGLNKKLASNKMQHEHDIKLPVRQIHSTPLKIIFWIRNLSDQPLELTLKRIQNCQCQHHQTRVGFNQFRQLFHCPHRRLIHINQELLRMQPGELLALTVTAWFFLFGEHYLTYEVHTSDKRTFKWTFHLEITAFDPEKCLLTTELIPINIKSFQRITQPIWVQNITMTHLTFAFTTRDRGLKLLNSNLTVPRQSIWPLMVEYRPQDYENELEITLGYDQTKARYKIKAHGVLCDEKETTDMPLKDIECVDYLYVIYPNRLNFELCLKEHRTQLVNVHNYDQNCMEFRWQNYVISEFFSITFEPSLFRLKPHHSKLCQIKVEVLDRYLHFRRIPIVMEVHRILDQATLIAQAELSEIESIDDPKYKQDSYVGHVFLQLNIRTKMGLDTEHECAAAETTDMAAGGDAPCFMACTPYATAPAVTGSLEDVLKTPEELREELVKRLSRKRKLTTNEVIELSMSIDQRVTIFEKLFWKYLSKSNFMRIPAHRNRRSQIKSYDMVISGEPNTPSTGSISDLDRNTVMDILNRLMVEGINDLAKNWIFIPSQYYERVP